MSYAPYTPETVSRLRALARAMSDGEIAAEFDWALDFVRKIASIHDIELRAGPRVCPGCGQPLQTPPGPPSVLTPPAVVESKRSNGAIQWSVTARELVRDGRAVALPHKEALVFDRLLRAMRDKAGPVSGSTLGELIGINYTPKLTVASLDRKLTGLGLTVQSRMGKGGGYHLLDIS